VSSPSKDFDRTVLGSYLAARSPEEIAEQAAAEGRWLRGRAAEGEFRLRLQENFVRFLSKSQDKEAFVRYCDGIMRAAEQTSDAEYMGSLRQKIVGAYFEAGCESRRPTGRPRKGFEGLFVHVWHLVNLDRRRDGLPLLTGQVPAKQIASRCNAEGWGDHDPAKIVDALRLKNRRLPCPYYGENTAT
jgi:hypothetical protein